MTEKTTEERDLFNPPPARETVFSVNKNTVNDYK
jgi:hypothetical protein